MRCSWARGVSLSVLSVASVASAQRPPDRGESLVLALEPLILRTPREQPHLTIAGTFGALEHGTTGTLAAYGYDRGAAMSLGLNARLVFPLEGCRCMTHGVDASVLWSNGTTLGAGGASAWERGIIDLGYAFRVELPCMRRGTRRWWVTGTVGVSGQRRRRGPRRRRRGRHRRAQRAHPRGPALRPRRPRLALRRRPGGRLRQDRWWASASTCATCAASTPTRPAPSSSAPTSGWASTWGSDLPSPERWALGRRGVLRPGLPGGVSVSRGGGDVGARAAGGAATARAAGAARGARRPTPPWGPSADPAR